MSAQKPECCPWCCTPCSTTTGFDVCSMSAQRTI